MTIGRKEVLACFFGQEAFFGVVAQRDGLFAIEEFGVSLEEGGPPGGRVGLLHRVVDEVQIELRDGLVVSHALVDDGDEAV